MVRLLQGTEEGLLRYCQDVNSSSRDSILVYSYKTNRGCNYLRHNCNLRDLLARLRLYLGDERFEATVMRHRVASAFLLNHVYERLSPEEQRGYKELSTSLLSNTSHNWFTGSFLVLAWAKLFSELFTQRDLVLLVPDFQGMDPSFIDVIRRVLLEHRPARFDLMAGFKPLEAGVSSDENGILWDVPVFRRLRESMASFEDAFLVDVPVEEGALASAPVGDPIVDVWDEDLDGRLFSILEHETDNQEVIHDSCAVLDRIFGAYDFRAALQFGLRLLGQEGSMVASERAFVHATVAVSAHNRQFGTSRGNEGFNKFLEYHLRKALELETDLVRRSVISYRLATTLARRRKNADASIACVNQSLEELRDNLEPSRKRAYYEAWLLNIRAYAHMLARNYRQSAADVESAFNLAEDFWNHSEDASPGEIYSAQLFAGNRATLAMYGQDNEALDLWFAKGTGLFEKRWDVGKRYVRYLSINIARRKLDLKAAVKAGHEGLADAIRERSADFQDLYRMNLVDLYFRLGDLDQVFFHLGQALELYDKLHEVRRRFTAMVALGAAERRAKNFKMADSFYRQAMELKNPQNPSVIVDILSARAELAASQGNFREAEALMDEAIELAVESGERDMLLLVARRAGDSFLLANDRDQAQEAYSRAVEIAGAVLDGDVQNPSSGDMARVWLGLYECSNRLEHLENMMRELPAALSEDSDLWWELPRVLSLLRGEEADALFEKNKPELDVLFRASSQRSDCQDLLAALPGIQNIARFQAEEGVGLTPMSA
jgi:tetratricopeptide (TPR) repeat protein